MFFSFTSCSDSPYVFLGCKLVDQPTQDMTDEVLGYSIDVCNGSVASPNNLVLDDNDSIRFSGWAMGPGNKCLDKLIAKVGNRFVSANYGFFRNDVQSAFGTEERAFGYVFCFSRSLFSDNVQINQIDLIGITNDGKQLKPVQVLLSSVPTTAPVTSPVQ